MLLVHICNGGMGVLNGMLSNKKKPLDNATFYTAGAISTSFFFLKGININPPKNGGAILATFAGSSLVVAGQLCLGTQVGKGISQLREE